MHKTLVRTPQEFDNFVAASNTKGPGPHTHCDGWSKPESYPCLVVYETRYRDNGPDEVEYEFVYLKEFAELLGIPSKLKIMFDGVNSGDGVQMKVDFENGDFIEVIGAYLPKNPKETDDYGVYCMAVNMRADGKPMCAYHGPIGREEKKEGEPTKSSEMFNPARNADGSIDRATATQMLLVNPTLENIAEAKRLGIV